MTPDTEVNGIARPPLPATEEGVEVRPRIAHPLAGSSLGHLVRLLWKNGPVSPSAIPTVAVALGAALLRSPFTTMERLQVVRLRRETSLEPSPVFIVGHWRSGTTHLYNILSKSPDFGFVTPLATGLPWEFLSLGKLLAPFLKRALPSDRFIDRIPVRPDSPQEDETAVANMQDVSFYHGLFFPRRFHHHFRRGIFLEDCTEKEIRRWERSFTDFLTKVHVDQGGRRLLVKNPVYTARVARLRALYPGAKFVHIHRNPYVVFQSTRNFYRALFEELALQDWSHVPIDEVVLRSYPRMMRSILEDASALPDADFVEIAFRDLEERPLDTVRAMYRGLELEGYDRARDRFGAYVESVSDYRKNRYPFPPRTLELVRRHWGEFVDRWGYAPPDPDGRVRAEGSSREEARRGH